jgi:hypothetical protein
MTTQWEESDSRKSTWQHNEENQIQGKVHDNTMRRIRFKEKYMTTQWEESDSRKSTWQHNEKNQMLGKVHDNTMRRIRC